LASTRLQIDLADHKVTAPQIGDRELAIAYFKAAVRLGLALVSVCSKFGPIAL
jgi:hypothetical protein